ncbi:hypothetical protein [Novosphingobium gossypii]|uniref:hypothetical protein n=1 Tax=Novosphingobium gossypii TaxID=1604774 RepID=UPI003D249639
MPAMAENARLFGAELSMSESSSIWGSYLRLVRALSKNAVIPVLVAGLGMASFGMFITLRDEGQKGLLAFTSGMLSVGALTAALGMFSVTFLQKTAKVRTIRPSRAGSRTVAGRPLTQSPVTKDLEYRLSRLESGVSAFNAASASQQAKIAADVLGEVHLALTDELIDRARERLEAQLSKETATAYVREAFEGTCGRLSREGEKTRIAGTYMLAIGGAISVFGMSILAFYLFVEKPFSLTNGIAEAAMHYVPRLSLVVIVEGFALFFLKLYKSSLEDMRYFQNELTNIEQRVVAYEIASAQEEDSLLNEVVRTVIATERNFTLKKGETTIGIEKAKIESGAGALAALKDLGPILGSLRAK